METITSVRKPGSIICRISSTNDSLNLLKTTYQLMDHKYERFFIQQKEVIESTMESSAILDERVRSLETKQKSHNSPINALALSIKLMS